MACITELQALQIRACPEKRTARLPYEAWQVTIRRKIC